MEQILIVSHLYPLSDHDLKGTFVRSQVQALSRIGAAPLVVAPRMLMPWPAHLLLARQRRIAAAATFHMDGHVPVIRPRVVAWPRYLGYNGLSGRILRSIRWAWRQARDWAPQLVHAHLAYPDGVAGLALARELGLPAIVTVHGRDVNWTLQQPALRAPILDALHRAAVVVAVGEPLAEALVKEGIGARVIPNGVEREFVAARAPAVRHDPEPVILTVANLVPGKGHDRVLRALAELARHFRFRYRVVGGGPLAGALRQLAARLDIADRVEWLGPLPHGQVAAALRSGHIFALPSDQEGFGISCLEAMATGLPVIVSRTAGVAKLLKHGHNAWLVNPGDQAELTGALASLLASAERRQELGRAAWQTIQSGHSWEDNARQMLAVYREVRGSGP